VGAHGGERGLIRLWGVHGAVDDAVDFTKWRCRRGVCMRHRKPTRDPVGIDSLLRKEDVQGGNCVEMAHAEDTFLSQLQIHHFMVAARKLQ
jgi:hypothetical protein